jgi:hypothetical protein
MEDRLGRLARKMRVPFGSHAEPLTARERNVGCTGKGNDGNLRQ